MSAVTELTYRKVLACAFAYPWFDRAVHALFEQGALDPADDVVLIDSHSTCGPAGRWEFPAVALVLDLTLNGEPHPNPGLLLRQPTTVGMLERIIEYVKSRPWED